MQCNATLSLTTTSCSKDRALMKHTWHTHNHDASVSHSIHILHFRHTTHILTPYMWHTHDSRYSRHVTHSRLATREALIQVALPDLLSRWSVRATSQPLPDFLPSCTATCSSALLRYAVMLHPLAAVSVVLYFHLSQIPGAIGISFVKYYKQFCKISHIFLLIHYLFHTCSSTDFLSLNIYVIFRKRLT